MAAHNLTENYTCSLAFAAHHAFKPFRTSVPNSVLEKFWGASNKLHVTCYQQVQSLSSDHDTLFCVRISWLFFLK